MCNCKEDKTKTRRWNETFKKDENEYNGYKSFQFDYLYTMITSSLYIFFNVNIYEKVRGHVYGEFICKYPCFSRCSIKMSESEVPGTLILKWFLHLTPDLLNQNLCGWSPGTCTLIKCPNGIYTGGWQTPLWGNPVAALPSYMIPPGEARPPQRMNDVVGAYVFMYLNDVK